MRYGHIAQMVYGKPWMILPSTLDTIVSLLTFRMEGGHLTAEEIEARIEAAGPRQRQQAQGGEGIAVIQLYGIIAPKASMFADTSTGGTGLDTFMGAFRMAMDNPEIKAIVLDVDSPGGQVGGIPEAAAEIRSARDAKQITAVVNNGIAASAAYYLASQAGEVVASPSSEVGSIGVRTAHEDRSGFYEQRGVKTTLISAGKFKDELSPFGPLSDEGRAYVQGQIDSLYSMFLSDVAKGRNVPVSTVRSDFGEGRMLMAKEAKAAGMIDRIDTLDGVLRRELSRPAAMKRPAALGPDWEAISGVPLAEMRAAEGLPEVEAPEAADMAVEAADAPTNMSGEHSAFDFELELHRRRIAR